MSKKNTDANRTSYYLKKAQEIGEIGTWDLDLINNVLIWTKQNYINFGVPFGTELNYEIFLNTIHPDDRERVDNEWQAALKGIPYDIEHRLIVDGKVKWVREKAEIEHNNKGDAIRALGVTQDITLQKKIEGNLKEKEYYLTKAQEIGNIGTWDLDLLQNRLIWTKQNYIIFDIPVGTKLSYELFLSYIHPEDREYVNHEWQEALKGKPYDIEHRLIVNNKIKWVREKAKLEYDLDGKPIRALGVTQDITDRIKNKKALETAMLKAEESNQLKTAFLANISHEIRTPLNGILGFTDLLLNESGKVDESQEKYLNIIKTCGYNLLNIISDIIDISKIESNQLHLKLKEFNLNECFRQSYQLIKRSLSENDKTHIQINLILGAEDHESNIISDSNRIQQILDNLLSNAVKYTEEGEINFGYNLIDNQIVQFYVHDTGIGIEKINHEKIFDRFGQVEDINQRNVGGTGLGLSISKSLAELLGGEISVESELNIGSKFLFELPLKRSKKIEQKKHTYSRIDTRDWQDKKILIVEDNIINSLYITEVLKSTGLQMDCVVSGEEAIEKSKTTNYDLILMDINLKAMNGYEAIKHIRSFNEQVPIIVQTGYALSDDRDKAMSVGSSGYISKPINMVELKSILNYHFK